MKWFYTILFSLLCPFAFQANAASCCVSNTSLPQLMTLPSRYQISSTLGLSRVQGDVDTKGQSTFRKDSNKDQSQTMRLDLSKMWKSWQGGISLSMVNRQRELDSQSNSAQGLSDIQLYMAKEEWWKVTKIFPFIKQNIPIANSLYNAKSALAVDAFGLGVYQTSIGAALIRNYKVWDHNFTTEIHQNWARTTGDTHVSAAAGGSMLLGAGYVPWKSRVRLGFSFGPRLESAKQIVTQGSTTHSQKSLVWDSVLSLGYQIEADQNIALNYADQTFFGPARNTTLTRAVTFLYQYRL